MNMSANWGKIFPDATSDPVTMFVMYKNVYFAMPGYLNLSSLHIV